MNATASTSTTAATTPLLEVRKLSVAYGGIKAVKHIDMSLHAGELVSLIGANGAGSRRSAACWRRNPARCAIAARISGDRARGRSYRRAW
jgi:ABC-type phosphonate transport system ATPase subunit